MTQNENFMEKVSRRKFLKIAGLLAGGSMLGTAPLFSGCGFPVAPALQENSYLVEKGKVTIMLDKATELNAIGGAASIINSIENLCLIIARKDEQEYIVAANECTHREKPIGYDHDAGLFICASGKSKFKMDGSVVKGPADKPLRIYETQLKEDNLIINL